MKHSNILSALYKYGKFLCLVCAYLFITQTHAGSCGDPAYSTCVCVCILAAGGFLSELLSTGQLIMMAYLWMCNGMIY